MNEVAFNLGLERWVGFGFAEINLLGYGAGGEKAFQQKKFKMLLLLSCVSS